MKVYLVGGAVRDKLLKRTIKECDYVVVGSTPSELISLGYQQVGNDFPVFLHPITKDEYALARTERKSGQGYTGFICDFTPTVTLEEDLVRRDLTVNAMAEDENGNIIDPFNGKADLDNKLLRHVSDAFSEDPLRILRVARFAARYHYLGFSIAAETMLLMQEMVAQGEINTLTKERIWLEIEKSLEDGAINVFTDVLAEINALPIILPPLTNHWSAQHSQQLAMLLTNLDGENQQLIAFCLWLKEIKPTEIKALSESLRLPNNYIDALNLFTTFYPTFKRNLATEEQVLALFNQADVWRRPERLNLFIETFSVLSKEHAAFAKKLKNAAKKATMVDVQVIIKQGFKGAEIKQQLDIARHTAIAEEFA
ncbi:tRNA nucleotidyltransferase [Pseudoalteromonas piratica]|uniref:tRNA nucleotidyltransferase n=1 Tax=Pseudoalteromonas piratica TaxID=1348114 RepID=A0A0A7EF57_9GAMM|nr:tRNA nucleotidyltransferase [Pseudoalteromonas piratica]AIY64691.1 tRNA nucleotidyltransferase [Pseudoalteromonas piratica]